MHASTDVGLELRGVEMSAGVFHYGVFSKHSTISRATRFGPFRGRVVNLSEIKTRADNSFMWEVSMRCRVSSLAHTHTMTACAHVTSLRLPELPVCLKKMFKLYINKKAKLHVFVNERELLSP